MMNLTVPTLQYRWHHGDRKRCLAPVESRHRPRAFSSASLPRNQRPRSKQACQAVIAPTPEVTASSLSNGGTMLLHGLGDIGEVSAAHLPWLLRLSHINATVSGGDSNKALQANARGYMTWRAALDRGLLPDDEAIKQIRAAKESFAAGHSVEELQWPAEPLRTMLIRVLAKLGVSRFAQKYPGVKEALLKSILEVVCKYHKTIAGIQDDEPQREKDLQGNTFKTVAELMAEQAAERAAKGNAEAQQAAQAAAAAEAKKKKKVAVGQDVPLDRRTAVALAKELYGTWQAPINALSNAGKAFAGLEALLGGARDGSNFDLQGNIWKRAGWAAMDDLRKRLEELKELRDLVRGLGRGAGWGPLRRAPVQHLDFNGRPGLLRTVLEAQETRGLTRSDDISRLLPAEAALLARGRSVRQSKLLFYAKMAEKGLQTYERDGWGEFSTSINPDRRQIRPTADMGPILLCVDTSGSMRGPRETVAKALALECMRAAKEQDRACYMFAFAGPAEVREVELNQDMRSVNNLLDFLEKVFNGGSDFNEPVKRCLERLTDARWANSDILLVSDGELRQPAQEIMRKLSGAKEKLGLRVHGLVIAAPDKKRADPAVLRALCTNYLPNGKLELLVSEFNNWASVQADSTFALDWDDVEGNSKRRLAGLKLEAQRTAESRRLKQQMKARGETPAGMGKPKGKKH